jgi:hypothetical protein
MLQTITLANQTFLLPVSTSDSQRRATYFETGTGSLTPDEQSILTAVGIDKKLESMLRPYLTGFFDGLPSCQSDTNLILQKDCEVVHYVLWQTLLAARYDATQRILQNKQTHSAMTDLETAMDEEAVRGLVKKVDPADEIKQIFTLLFINDIPEKTYTVNDIFTLITFV